MTGDQALRLNEISAHLDSLHSLVTRLAQDSEGDHDGADLILAGTFYSIGNAIWAEKEGIDAVLAAAAASKAE